jgi:hypothetical protein
VRLLLRRAWINSQQLERVADPVAVLCNLHNLA